MVLATVTGSVYAGSKDVRYAPEAKWVAPVPTGTTSETPAGAAVRMIYFDSQVFLGPNGMEAFQAFRIRILKPEALQVGNLSVAWNPAAGDATVHRVRIIRNGETIDVLAKLKFNVIQREGFLENAMLNGNMTATLQVPGLQVGDELEFAATTQAKDPTLGDHVFGFVQLARMAMSGGHRARILWPKASRVRWKASPDVENLVPVASKGNMELTFELRDPHAAPGADGAPDRVNVRRFIEMSDFASWAELSSQVASLFDKASALKKDSPVLKEIAQIEASSQDPLLRLRAALRLVQDRVRYFYIGLNGGNLMPASADDTWDRAFGDCKAKTALLMGVLRRLGIPAEAVLVDVAGGDGINDHLPSPGAFNHVVVRAHVGDRTYWLDGTRQGDSRLTSDPPGAYRWVLPLRSTGGDLESLALKAPVEPLELSYIYADASQGFDQRAKVEMKMVLRGDQAMQMRAALSVMPGEDAQRGLLSFWRNGNGWFDPTSTSWSYDDDRGTLLLMVQGTGKLDWEGDKPDGRRLDLFGAGFFKPQEFRRPTDQDQAAPWKLPFPYFKCWATAVRLPLPDKKWSWDYTSPPVNRHMGGYYYYRTADLRDGLIRTVMSRKVEVAELSADDATRFNEQLTSFDHNMSRVYQVDVRGASPIENPASQPPFTLDMDWTRPDVPCGQDRK